MSEAKLQPLENPCDKCRMKSSNCYCNKLIAFRACDVERSDMLKFFNDFLQEHIDLCKERHWETMQLIAIQINFRSRFMEKSSKCLIKC